MTQTQIRIDADAIYSAITEALTSDEFKDKGVMATAKELIKRNQQAQELTKRLDEAKKRYKEHEFDINPLPIDEAVALEDEIFELVRAINTIFNLILKYVCKHRNAYNPYKDWYYEGYDENQKAYEFRSRYYVQGSQVIRYVWADSETEAWDKLTPLNE